MRQLSKDTAWLDGRWANTFDRNDLRRRWERLLNRTAFLNPHDRTLLEMTLEQGARISRLSPLTRQDAGTIRRRLRDITRRLTACELQAVLEYPDAFSAFEKICLCEHLIRKRPLAHIARDLNTTVYTLRKTLTVARAKAHRLCDAAPAAGG